MDDCFREKEATPRRIKPTIIKAFQLFIPPSATPRYIKADLLILSSTLIATSGWIFSLKALQGLPPLLFMGIRFLAAGLLISLPALFHPDRNWCRSILSAILPGFLLGLAMMLWILGLRLSSNIGVGAFICSLGNILAPLVGRVVLGWKLPRSTQAALVLSAIGMAFLFLKNGQAGTLDLGDTLFLVSAIANAFYLVFNTRLTARTPILTLTAVQLLVTGLLSLAASTAFETWPATGSVPPATLGWVAASILFATSLRFFLQVSGQSAAPITHTALMMCLEPVWTTLVAAIWLSASMQPLQAVGCGLIFIALIVNGRRRA